MPTISYDRPISSSAQRASKAFKWWRARKTACTETLPFWTFSRTGGRTKLAEHALRWPVDRRWEPGAGKPHAGSVPGGGPKGPTLSGQPCRYTGMRANLASVVHRKARAGLPALSRTRRSREEHAPRRSRIRPSPGTMPRSRERPRASRAGRVGRASPVGRRMSTLERYGRGCGQRAR
jgi:hypothetical protein